MTSSYTAIRNYITGKVLSAWSGTTVVKAQDARERDTNFAIVNLAGPVTITGQSPTLDEAEFVFNIVGRFTLAGGADAELEALTKGAALRDALLDDKNPGSVGYLPMVTSVETEGANNQDNRYEVAVTFRCMATVAR